MVYWFGPQNQVGDGFSVAPQTRREDATAQDTRQDIAAYFAWKQVNLGFPSLPQNWQRHDGGWCTWHHRGGCIAVKSKMNGSMRRATSDPATLALLFSLY
jgi:hypothetical protein